MLFIAQPNLERSFFIDVTMFWTVVTKTSELVDITNKQLTSISHLDDGPNLEVVSELPDQVADCQCRPPKLLD